MSLAIKMRDCLRLVLIHPSFDEATSIISQFSLNDSFYCRTFTQIDFAIEFLDNSIQDIVLFSSDLVKSNDFPLLNETLQRKSHLLVVIVGQKADQEFDFKTLRINAKISCLESTKELIQLLESVKNNIAYIQNPSIGIPNATK